MFRIGPRFAGVDLKTAKVFLSARYLLCFLLSAIVVYFLIFTEISPTYQKHGGNLVSKGANIEKSTQLKRQDRWLTLKSVQILLNTYTLIIYIKP